MNRKNSGEFKARKQVTFMTRHWIGISKMLRAARPDLDDVFDYEVWKRIVFEIGAGLQADNDRFQLGRFYTECGMPPKRKKSTASKGE
jgi:hypothetical protein